MKTIIVLGMHRSCTSLIAKGLFMTGDCNMGEYLIGSNDGNKKGHFEDLGFVTMNDVILSLAGGSWDNPPPEDEIINAGKRIKNSIKKLIKDSECEPLWGWKDPRTTLTIRCYLPYLTNPIFVSCFRNPNEVAKSLTKRDGTNFEDNLKLANEYNKRLINFLNEYH